MRLVREAARCDLSHLRPSRAKKNKTEHELFMPPSTIVILWHKQGRIPKKIHFVKNNMSSKGNLVRVGPNQIWPHYQTGFPAERGPFYIKSEHFKSPFVSVTFDNSALKNMIGLMGFPKK